MKASGLPVDSIPPMGAIYLTARIHPFGTPHPDGARAAHQRATSAATSWTPPASASCPSRPSAPATDDGWFRLSVGAVSMAEIEEALPRLEDALRQLG